MTCVVISQPMYLPWAGFLAQLSMADVLIWLDDAQFSKGSFTNRVQVPKGRGTGWLSIPLVDKGSQKKIHELEPAQDDWVARHRSNLRNVYGHSLRYGEVENVMDQILDSTTLCDAIIVSSEALVRAMRITLPPTHRSSELGLDGHGSERVMRLVQAVGGTRYLTGMGARNYLEHEKFEVAGIDVDYMNYDLHPWPQTDAAFTPYITGLDLVANVDPAGRKEHLNPKVKNWREVIGS